MSPAGPEDRNQILECYRAKIVTASEGAEVPFIERKFIDDEKWRRYSASEAFRYSGILREREPELESLLTIQCVVVVGEPGAGKSTIAQEAARRLAAVETVLPILLNLRSYRGDLADLLGRTVPPAILGIQDLRRHYICDGLDEVPREYVAQAIKDLVELSTPEQDAGFLITSRQAFFANHSPAFGRDFRVFHVLDFDEDDLRRFARSRGLDPQQFLDSAEDSGIGAEIRNPLNAWTISSLLLDGHHLSALRSENLNTVIEGLLKSRTTISLIRLRRAVQLLGVSMEVYSRNELSLEEARSVLTIGLAITQAEAQRMLDELMQSILLQTPNGVIFQLRTYGEFLAAIELQNQPFARIRTLFSLDDGTPNPSWLHAIALLAELNGEVRRYFIQHYPTWLLGSSVAAFSSDERTEIITRLLSDLSTSGQYLFNHPTIRAYSLAKLLTPEAQQNLLRDISSTHAETQANAFLVLGLAKGKAIIPTALAVALDVQRGDPVRMAALTALSTIEAPELLDDLIPALTRNDLHYTMMLECIGMNVAEEDLGRAIPVILSTDTLLSGVYYRFRNIRSRATSLHVLEYLEAHPEVVGDMHAESYLEPFFKEVAGECDDAVVESLVKVLVATEQRHVPITPSFERLLVEPIIDCQKTERAATLLLLHYYENGQIPFRLAQRLGRWMTMHHAEWIIDAGAFALLRNLSPFIPIGEVRQFLSPYTFGLMEEQEQNSAKSHQEERERQQRREEQSETRRRAIAEGTFWDAMNAAATLDEKEWPALTAERRAWLASEASARLLVLDLSRTIFYGEQGSWHQPPELQTLLRIVDHYELRIDRDETLVLTMKAWPGVTITNHYKRFGFSAEAANLFLEFVQRTHERPTPHENVLAFLEETDFTWLSFTDDLLRFVRDPESGHLGARALSVLVKRGVSTEILIECERSGSESIRDIAFAELVKRQHRGTISRAIAQLMDSVESLRDADVGPPIDGPAAWIEGINSVWAWEDLARLRRVTLRNGLVYLCDTVTTKLRKLDVARLAKTVRAQLVDAPETWRARQSAFALECERDGLILAAQSLPFDRVLTLLKRSTSLISLKVYVEGSTDAPFYARFLNEIGEPDLAERIDVVGGWPNLLNRPVDRWLDGCREAVIIMDGDKGREYGKPKLRYSSDARLAFRRFKHHPIHLFVLERYGVENYFTQAAVESITSLNLAGQWPLPIDKAVKDHLTDSSGASFYSKGRNADVASRMSISEIESTDLGRILCRIAELASRARQD
ncbi:MAG TPA: hypothetical protein VMB19_15500 [Silvibacterium sp.]|nr:hypothetical protein [Silvibacterium sp.]